MWRPLDEEGSGEGSSTCSIKLETILERSWKKQQQPYIMTFKEESQEEALTGAATPADGAVDEPECFKAWRARERVVIQYLEDVTKRPLREQERMLEHILSKNGHCEYLRRFGLNGATDVKTFRERVPVSDYNDVWPFVQRIMNGDFSPVLCGDRIVEILQSSGTTNGKGKLHPVTEEDLNLRTTLWNIMTPALNRALPGLEKGKCLFFYSVHGSTVTPGGIVAQSATTSFIRSKMFRERLFNPTYRLTSPDGVFNTHAPATDVMYAHLLLALVQREHVMRMGAIFAYGLVRAIRYLEEFWPDLCEDIRNGTTNEGRLTTEHIKKEVMTILRPDPARADALREICSSESWEGILKRIWPNLKVLDTVSTGASSIYLPNLDFYSGKLPVICTQFYACTEGFFGINCEPTKPPEENAYTLIPTIAYYEFIPVKPRRRVSRPVACSDAAEPERSRQCTEEILDLTQLEIGQEYEILITTVSGLYRYSIGDILKVVGFYNATPSFQVVRRKKTLISVSNEKTDEQDLFLAVTAAAKLLEPLQLRVHDYTSTADLSQKVGHYVIFWELAQSTSDSTSSCTDVPEDVLDDCCGIIETNLNDVYREYRRDGYIGAAEIRILKPGTFDEIVKHAFSIGTTVTQYKTPRGIEITNAPVLAILEAGTAQRHQWRGTPDPSWRQPLPSSPV
ncbi:hypothetical protein R1flu_025656 [Riccia fluitans]|uniref:Uncharacterized protein n=1 Tax=Riccia fluitans TaxID=41844 RepID=A0ABD1XYT5_9MARC